MMTMLHRGVLHVACAVALLWACGAMASPADAPAAHRQDPRAPAVRPGDAQDPFDDRDDARGVAPPLPWKALDPAQRSLLAPLRMQWDQLPPRRQQRMAARAARWQQLPPGRREQIRQRIARWAQLTPQQQHEAMQGGRRFDAMAPADRQRVRDAYERFQSLSPEQRRMLMQRFREERAARGNAGRDVDRPKAPPR